MSHRPSQTPDSQLPQDPDLSVLRQRAFNLRWATVAEDVIPLTAADPDLTVSPVVAAAITDYVAKPHFCYGPPAGLAEFRSAIAAHFAATKAAVFDPEQVVATNSAANGMARVCEFLLRAGDEVVVQDPVDFVVAETARRAGADLRYWPRDGRRFTPTGLARVLTDRTKAVLVCHPHNPTGQLLDRDEVGTVAALCSDRGIQLVSDEVWADVVHGPDGITSFAAHGQAACRPWVVYGLSKGYGLAGLRIGAVVAPDAGSAVNFMTATGFEHTIEGASTLSQVAAIAAVRDASAWRAEFVAHCRRQLDTAAERLRRLAGLRVPPSPAATFVLFVDASATGIDEFELAARIEKVARVRVVPGSPRWFGPGAKGHLRVSVATTAALLDEALSRIEAAWPAVLTG